MFLGQHEHSLDAKDRLTIPARFRASMADGIVLLAGLDTCVEIWPQSEFQEFADKFLGKLNPLSSKARSLRRRFYGGAENESLDSAGRVRIAKHLIKHGALSGPCVVVGSEDHLEVWEPEAWAEQSAKVDAEAAAMAEELAEVDFGS